MCEIIHKHIGLHVYHQSSVADCPNMSGAVLHVAIMYPTVNSSNFISCKG